MEYLVTWTIELDASDPHEAARMARDFQLEGSALVGAFHVEDERGEITFVDLDLEELDDDPQ